MEVATVSTWSRARFCEFFVQPQHLGANVYHRHAGAGVCQHRPMPPASRAEAQDVLICDFTSKPAERIQNLQRSRHLILRRRHGKTVVPAAPAHPTRRGLWIMNGIHAGDDWRTIISF